MLFLVAAIESITSYQQEEDTIANRPAKPESIKPVLAVLHHPSVKIDFPLEY